MSFYQKDNTNRKENNARLEDSKARIHHDLISSYLSEIMNFVEAFMKEHFQFW